VLRLALLGLGWFAVIAFTLVGVVGGAWPGAWDESSATDQIVFVVLSVGGAALLAGGLWLIDRARWPGAALVSIGAIVGALPIFWTLIALVVAAALVVLSVMYARRAPAAV
jgi:hypothetical protein